MPTPPHQPEPPLQLRCLPEPAALSDTVPATKLMSTLEAAAEPDHSERDAQRSRPVRSNQQQPHPGLPRLLARHLRHRWQPPPAPADSPALAALEAALQRAAGHGFILDSFCGTGHSTRMLAARFPGHLVIGVDKSAHRLQRHGQQQGDNYLLLRARCEPVWQKLLDLGCHPERHYLLYPNPWPKAAQLKRRVHGHPAFAALLALGGRLELRCNWQLYAEEFGLALSLAGHAPLVQRVPEGPALSLFERKYRASGHELWRCLCEVPAALEW